MGAAALKLITQRSASEQVSEYWGKIHMQLMMWFYTDGRSKTF